MAFNDPTPLGGKSYDQLRQILEAGSSDDRELVQDVAHNPICSVFFDEAVPCISVAWKRYATSLQLRFICETILALLTGHRVNRVLGDVAGLPAIHGDDQTWIIEDVIPRATAAGLAAIAYNTPASYFARVSFEGVVAALPASVAVRNFTDPDEARRWLRDIPPRGASQSA